jgi:hypothetical protein
VPSTGFSLSGERFIGLPVGALGVLAIRNDNPLERQYSNYDSDLFRITEKTNTSLKLVSRSPSAHTIPVFLGAIVSPDRSWVYWQNDTNPLP